MERRGSRAGSDSLELAKLTSAPEDSSAYLSSTPGLGRSPSSQACTEEVMVQVRHPGAPVTLLLTNRGWGSKSPPGAFQRVPVRRLFQVAWFGSQPLVTS